MESEKYQEIWIDSRDNPGGPLMMALINGDRGWLMYQRHPDGDAGYSSRNPSYDGESDAKLEFVLSNGQCDEYPLAWVISIEQIERAFSYFYMHESLPPFISWHQDFVE